MFATTVQRHWWKWTLLLTGTVVGILPGGCEKMILRAATPFFI